MKKNLLVIVFLMVINLSYGQVIKITGKVIGENMEDCPGSKITDLRTNNNTIADSAGIYHFEALAGDTLQFYFVGYTRERRVVINSSDHINMLLMNKEVNDLGAVWTKKQWKKANKQVEKTYLQLENKAGYLGKWNY